MIKPTIGRIVWFFPSSDFMKSRMRAFSDPSQPLAAMITYVWNDKLVNLVVSDQNGVPFSVTSVDLLESGAEHQLSHHAEWMPYQQKQAEKELLTSDGGIDDGSKSSGSVSGSTSLISAIQQALDVLERLDPLFNDDVNEAYNILISAAWYSLTPTGADKATLRIVDRSNLGAVPCAPANSEIEREIEASSANLPRVTPADIEGKIAGEYFFVTEAKDQGLHIASADEYQSAQQPVKSLMTFCVLQLTNGFTVIGESSCVSPEGFDPEIGKKVARNNAITKIWPLMGYALQEKLHDGSL